MILARRCVVFLWTFPDIFEAEKILNEDHYGLTDVKDRILEFIAVTILKKDVQVCFAGRCVAPVRRGLLSFAGGAASSRSGLLTHVLFPSRLGT